MSNIFQHLSYPFKSVICLFFVVTIFSSKGVNAKQRSVNNHGMLTVFKGQIVHIYQVAVSLAGPSLFWSTKDKEGEPFYTNQTVKAMAEIYH
jgi:hypothetical protein